MAGWNFGSVQALGGFSGEVLARAAGVEPVLAAAHVWVEGRLRMLRYASADASVDAFLGENRTVHFAGRIFDLRPGAYELSYRTRSSTVQSFFRTVAVAAGMPPEGYSSVMESDEEALRWRYGGVLPPGAFEMRVITRDDATLTLERASRALGRLMDPHVRDIEDQVQFQTGVRLGATSSRDSVVRRSLRGKRLRTGNMETTRWEVPLLVVRGSWIGLLRRRGMVLPEYFSRPGEAIRSAKSIMGRLANSLGDAAAGDAPVTVEVSIGLSYRPAHRGLHRGERFFAVAPDSES